MKFLSLILLLISFNTHGALINCSAKKNLEEIWKLSVDLESETRQVIGEVEQFRIYLKNIDDINFEIEVFDPSIPSRQYSQGSLESDQQELVWRLWNRKVILEVFCSR